ncbi:MAG: hypothetical protein M3139_08950 [Bacteroidota bacterium]|nr:hypothetical protein [Bacteroidota bacterium]
MQNIWEGIKNYYITLGKNYHVNPIIFLGIHVIATPLFIISTAWIIKNYRQKKPLVLPVITALLIFNAANLYLAFFGKQIPWWIYTLLIITTIASGFYSYTKIRKKIKTTNNNRRHHKNK